MRTIMFNDRYGLTKAVLQGRKKQTRRNSCRYKVGEVREEQQKPKRWRAKVDEIYYLINFDEMDVFFTRDLHLTIDDSHFSNLNYFRTAEQAKEAAKRIKQTLQNYHKEIGE